MPAAADYNPPLPPRLEHRSALAIDVTEERAVVPALVIEELARRAERPPASLFDLIVGSSAGGLLALALAHPGGSGPLELSRLYEDLRRWYEVGMLTRL